jgi:hypothetical protein
MGLSFYSLLMESPLIGGFVEEQHTRNKKPGMERQND